MTRRLLSRRASDAAKLPLRLTMKISLLELGRPHREPRVRRSRLFILAFALAASCAGVSSSTAEAESAPMAADRAEKSASAPSSAGTKAANPSAVPAATPHVLVIDKRAMQEIASREAKLLGLPFSLVDTVIKIESDYRPDRIGDVGEIGLMQVRPTTAAMMGFHGTAADLADPATNIHYGSTYLGTAWRLAKGDVCRALMKYRAGHGNETMSPLSVSYCERARLHLASIGSPLAATITPADLVAVAVASIPKGTNASGAKDILPSESLKVGGRPKTGQAFWTAFQSRIKRVNAATWLRCRR